MNLRKGCLVWAVCIAMAYGISYLATAGLLYLIMWGLAALGVVLPIAWSWGLSAIIWLILFLSKSSFNITIEK